jgi:plastocyanin
MQFDDISPPGRHRSASAEADACIRHDSCEWRCKFGGTGVENSRANSFAAAKAGGLRALGVFVLCALATAQLPAAELDPRILDSQGNGVGDGVVAVYPVGKSFPPLKDTKAQIDQRGLSFVGQVLAVQTGTKVAFPNSDNVRHHVYSFSSAKTFELKLYSGNHASAVVFDKPGVVTLGCNIHDWMLGYVYVVDTPYFTKTDADGRATLTNLPEGDYELRVWHPRLSSAREFISENLTLGGSPVQRSFNILLHPAEQSNHPPEGLELGLDARAHEHAN